VLSLSHLPTSANYPSTLNEQTLRFKQWSAGRAFAFGALDYARRDLTANDLVIQARELLVSGFDGIKMWEGKPSVYVHLPDRLEGSLYAPYWKWAETQAYPITIHMADPQRFWDPARAGLDRWSFVGDEYPTREQMYAETERILNRHPRLKMIFAHFLFFWDDLPRAARFLDAHPSVVFDLTPAVAGYLDLSENRDAARAFFLHYQDRLIYGTDIGAGPVVDPQAPFEPEKEIGQSWLVRAFLETDWDIALPAGIGAVTNQFAGKQLRGIALPNDVLEKIYWRNFECVVGQTPRTIRL
jgi:predicted TIM-barrel fold metal-dependent hydrolase